MRKTLVNIRTLVALLIASAAFTACSNEDGAIIGEQPAQEQGPQLYTLTIQAGKADNAQTRALALDGEKIVAKWADGDKVAVTNSGGTKLGELTASNVSTDGKTCTLSGALDTAPSVGETLTLTYHPVTMNDYKAQDGSLAGAAKCDKATAEVTVATVEGGEITIDKTAAEFKTQTAVLKITMKDASDNMVNATKLEVKLTKVPVEGLDGTVITFSPQASAYSANGDGILYFALPDVDDAKNMVGALKNYLTSTSLRFTVTYDVGSYTASPGKKYIFEAGKYYATTLTKPAPTYPFALSKVTSDYIGGAVCADGNVYPAKTAAPDGKTVVGILGKVTEIGHGLILALHDATDQTGNDINRWTLNVTYASTNLRMLPDDTARGSLTSYTTLGSTEVSNWAVAQKSDYEAIFSNLGSTRGDELGKTYDGNVNAYITTGVGGTALSGDYWSATWKELDRAYDFDSNWWSSPYASYPEKVRPVLGF